MTLDNYSTGDRFQVLSRRGVKVYQLVTGNEGPSPLMKRYLKTRKKGQPRKPVRNDPHEVL